MLSKLEEIKLVTLCVTADDRNAFERIVGEYSPAVRNFLFRLTSGDAMLTDDLSQETFIKAYLQLRSFKALARLSTWLLSIAYHEYISHVRRRSEMALPDDYVPDRDTGAADSSSQRQTEARHDVDVALSALSPTERTIVILFYIDDRPIKEVARITGLPQGTVKSYLSRARTKMANELKNDLK